MLQREAASPDIAEAPLLAVLATEAHGHTAVSGAMRRCRQPHAPTAGSCCCLGRSTKHTHAGSLASEPADASRGFLWASTLQAIRRGVEGGGRIVHGYTRARPRWRARDGSAAAAPHCHECLRPSTHGRVARKECCWVPLLAVCPSKPNHMHALKPMRWYEGRVAEISPLSRGCQPNSRAILQDEQS